MKLVAKGNKLNFCPICKAPTRFLHGGTKNYYCSECKSSIPIPPVDKVPSGRIWTMDYDLLLKKWYYLDKRANRIPV